MTFFMSLRSSCVIVPMIWSNGPIQGPDSDLRGRHRWQDTGGTDAALQGNGGPQNE
jgi:hypothetical protein